MKQIILLSSLILIAAALVSCAGEPVTAMQVENNPIQPGNEIPLAESPVSIAESNQVLPDTSAWLTQDYPNALSLRSQLIVGTFRLEGTPLATTPEQAGEFLPLWQLLRTLSGTDSSNQMETEAVMIQIQETMNTEQLLAIQEMRLTDADNQALLESLGISAQGSAMGGQGTGQGKNMTEAEKAARRATQGVTESQAGTGGAGGARAILDKLIELLDTRQAGL
ncbi:MAG: hypothetical protein R6V73_13770 [Anaerolineales bacterium]|jgi:hypothetical protein